MRATFGKTGPYRLWVLFIAAGFLAAALVSTALLTTSAFSERRAASAAADLRFAALTVSAADEAAVAAGASGTPSADSEAALRDALETLAADRDDALRTLSPADRARATELLDEVSQCAIELLTPDGAGNHDVHPHDELQVLLASAADDAATKALTAERRALASVGIALLALMVTGWMVVRARFRSERSDALASAGRRLQILVNDSPDVFLVISPAGGVTYRSPSAERLLHPDESTLESLIAVAPSEDQAALRSHVLSPGAAHEARVVRLRDIDDAWGWFEVRVSDMCAEPEIAGFLVTVHDITREVALRDDLRHQADTDVLTGLPNRRALDQILDDARTDLVRHGRPVGLLVLDLDGFKQINDTLGHRAGDAVLTDVAQRLRQVAAAHGTVVRLGGDEFAVVMTDLRCADQAQQRAQQILAALSEPFEVGNRSEQLHTSVGIGLTDQPQSVTSLIAEADIAMYQAKRQGGNAAVVFAPEMEADALASTRIARALRAADHDAEFGLVYQPINESFSSGGVVGYEALLRWTSPSLGAVLPDEFIPIAEASGDIVEIGRWVLNAVCAQLAEWQDDGLEPGITVSLNVSAKELAETGFVSGVMERLAHWGVAPDRLVIEVTETSVLDHTGIAQQRLQALRAAGIRIAIDDFGSGYSNLGQLLSVPFDIIKIDRSLLLTLSAMREQAGDDPTGPCAIMEAVVAIAGVLGADALCEGVETDIQRRSLERSGVRFVQGYASGRPQPADQIVIASDREVDAATLESAPAAS